VILAESDLRHESPLPERDRYSGGKPVVRGGVVEAHIHRRIENGPTYVLFQPEIKEHRIIPAVRVEIV
jgi:hypothetical protein